MKICVTRTGSPLWWGTMQSTRASESGECDTEPLIRYLSHAGHDVAYYGPIRNYDGMNSPLECVFDIDLSGVNRHLFGKAFDDALAERCDPVIDALIEWAPDLVLELPGDKFTWYRPNNDHGVEILDCCWRYGFCVGYMYHRTKYKRNWIITDPVLYPRNGEMMYSWPETWPNAILSQEEATWIQIIQGRSVKSYARYAGCENWLTWNMKQMPYSTGPYHVVIAAHTHHKRAQQHPGHRRSIWQGILNQCPRTRNRTAICGRGWPDAFEMPSDDAYKGILPTFADVMRFMQQGLGGPVLPQKLGFNTSKPRFYALNGACPYLFDRDPLYRYCYDANQRILPLSHYARWEYGSENSRPHCLNISDQQRHDAIELVLKRTTPNFSVLEEFIELRGDNKDRKFGGYKLL